MIKHDITQIKYLLFVERLEIHNLWRVVLFYLLIQYATYIQVWLLKDK